MRLAASPVLAKAAVASKIFSLRILIPGLVFFEPSEPCIFVVAATNLISTVNIGLE
jgi:hypothetical protein